MMSCQDLCCILLYFVVLCCVVLCCVCCGVVHVVSHCAANLIVSYAVLSVLSLHACVVLDHIVSFSCYLVIVFIGVRYYITLAIFS